jgi:hypothetical protein
MRGRGMVGGEPIAKANATLNRRQRRALKRGSLVKLYAPKKIRT